MESPAESVVEAEPESTAVSRQGPDAGPRISSRGLAAAATVALFSVMVGLCLFITDRYRALQVQSLGEVGAIYVDRLLAPYALAQTQSDAHATALRAAIASVISDHSREAAGIVLRIWSTDGTLLFSSVQHDSPDLHDPSDLTLALGGAPVTRLEVSGPAATAFPIPFPFFEIYVPIHDPATGRIVAVGEIYQDARKILQDRAFVDRTVWTATAFATLCLLGLFGISLRQSRLLEARLDSVNRVAALNERLRREADQARLEAVQAKEQLLNLVGAELHDGPVQMLGLISLITDHGPGASLPDGTSLATMVRNVHAELRNISSGLVLPEVERLDTHGVIDLATSRHRSLAGQDVELDIGTLPAELDTPRKVCLFRVIQEGLRNAARHGEGSEPHLSVTGDSDALRVLLRNRLGAAGIVGADGRALSLGLQGMRRRLEVFGGKCSFETDGGEAKLTVELPLGPSRGAALVS